jgi:uncharacterized membrane protein
LYARERNNRLLYLNILAFFADKQNGGIP